MRRKYKTADYFGGKKKPSQKEHHQNNCRISLTVLSDTKHPTDESAIGDQVVLNKQMFLPLPSTTHSILFLELQQDEILWHMQQGESATEGDIMRGL